MERQFTMNELLESDVYNELLKVCVLHIRELYREKRVIIELASEEDDEFFVTLCLVTVVSHIDPCEEPAKELFDKVSCIVRFNNDPYTDKAFPFSLAIFNAFLPFCERKDSLESIRIFEK